MCIIFLIVCGSYNLKESTLYEREYSYIWYIRYILGITYPKCVDVAIMLIEIETLHMFDGSRRLKHINLVIYKHREIQEIVKYVTY